MPVNLCFELRNSLVAGGIDAVALNDHLFSLWSSVNGNNAD